MVGGRKVLRCGDNGGGDGGGGVVCSCFVMEGGS